MLKGDNQKFGRISEGEFPHYRVSEAALQLHCLRTKVDQPAAIAHRRYAGVWLDKCERISIAGVWISESESFYCRVASETLQLF